MNDNNITSAIVSGILNSEAFAGAIRSAIEKQISSALSDARHYVHLKSLVEDQVEAVLDGMDLREHITDAMSGMDADDMGIADSIDEAVRENLAEHEVRAGDILGLDEAIRDEVANTNWEEVLDPVISSRSPDLEDRVSQIEVRMYDMARDVSNRAQEISDLLSDMATKFARLAGKEQI